MSKSHLKTSYGVLYRNSKQWIRVMRGPDGWYTAAISTNSDKPRPYHFHGQTVLGRYATEQAAVDAAEMVLAMRGGPHVCTLRDIDQVRKEAENV